MPPTPPPPGPEGPRPSAAEAARALHDMGWRQDQSRSSADHARWVYVLFGIVFVALFAAPDFFGEAAGGWPSAAFGALTVGYVALLNTRRGSALLGQPVRTRRQEISGPFRRYALLILLAVLLAGVAFQLLQPDRHLGVPYWRTAVGVTGGAALAVFGPRCRQALLSAATRDRRHPGRSTVHGTR